MRIHKEQGFNGSQAKKSVTTSGCRKIIQGKTIEYENNELKQFETSGI